jgi:hypothetical protein
MGTSLPENTNLFLEALSDIMVCSDQKRTFRTFTISVLYRNAFGY